jgi:hypothetical protein
MPCKDRGVRCGGHDSIGGRCGGHGCGI